MAFSKALIPEPLVSAYREGRCAMLVGAGASVGAGLPTWRGLLELMIAEGERMRLIRDERLAEYHALISDNSKFLMVAGGLKEDLGSYFDGFVESTFINPAIEPTGLHEAIVHADRLKFVITTNYDPCSSSPTERPGPIGSIRSRSTTPARYSAASKSVNSSS